MENLNEEDLLNLIKEGKKFEAIKKYKYASSCSLELARSYIDNIEKTYIINQFEDEVEKDVARLILEGEIFKAVRLYSERTGCELMVANKFVVEFAKSPKFHPPGVIQKKKGCFIATVCYGTYNAPEVVILREFRDKVLEKNFFGRIFIKIYYFISPGFSILIDKSEKGKFIIKKYFLSTLVNYLKR